MSQWQTEKKRMHICAWGIEIMLAEFKWEGHWNELCVTPVKTLPCPHTPPVQHWGIRSMFHPLLWKKYFGHTPVTAGCEELCLFALQVICSPTAAKNPCQCYILQLSKELKICYRLFYVKHKHLCSFWFREQLACI